MRPHIEVLGGKVREDFTDGPDYSELGFCDFALLVRQGTTEADMCNF